MCQLEIQICKAFCDRRKGDLGGTFIDSLSD